MLFKSIVPFLAVLCFVSAQRGCSRDRLRQCEDSLMRNMQRRYNDLSRQDMISQCQNMREDFNCLLKETRCLTSESDRSRYGDSLRNSIKYIRDGCDSSGGGWRESTCFIGSEIKNCESSFPLGGIQYSTHNPETCRKYNLFSDCVMDTVRRQCRSDDERLMGQYLVDSAQDLAWNCGETTSTSDFDRSRDDRYRDDRTRDDRTRDDRNYGNNDRYNDRERDFRGGNGNYNNRDDRNRDDRNGYDRDRYGNGRNSGTYTNGNGSDISCCRYERCDRNRLQQCRDSLARTVDSRTSGYQDSQKCRRARDDFNCLLWQTSSCVNREDKDRDNEIFRKARDFISRNCDTYGRWSENSCYKSSEMQRCEGLLLNTRGGANYESCRAYNSFKECMTREVERRCTREDDIYQGAYLADKAQEMSWQCTNDQQTSSNDNYNRNQWSTFDRRDQYDRDNYDRDNISPGHLDDEDAMCLARMQSATDTCKRNMDNKRNYMNDAGFEEKTRLNCCSIREYRSCLYDATKRYCQTERSKVVDTLMAGYRHILSQDSCLRIYDSECNAGSNSQLSFVLLATCLVVLSALFSFRH